MNDREQSAWRRHFRLLGRADLRADVDSELAYHLDRHARELERRRRIAIAVAVTATIFRAVHSILVRPLPYPDADRLVRVCCRHSTRRALIQWSRCGPTSAAYSLYNIAPTPAAAIT